MEAFLKMKKRLMDGIVDDDEFSSLFLLFFLLRYPSGYQEFLV